MEFKGFKNVSWYGADPLRAFGRAIENGQTRLVPGSLITDQILSDHGPYMVIADTETGKIEWSGGQISETVRRTARLTRQVSYKVITWWGREPFRELGRTLFYGQGRQVPARVISTRLLDRYGAFLTVLDSTTGKFDWIGSRVPKQRRSVTLA